MKIRIPDLNGQKQYIENKSSIVLIGANGAGKTRMSVWIDENNPEYPVQNGYIPMEKRTDDGEMHRIHFCLMTMKN